MADTILGPDGKPILKVPGIEIDGRPFPYRIVNQEAFNKVTDPRTLSLGVLTQLRDQNNIVWLGIMKLAKDVYARSPDGPREFQKFCDDLGLTIIDGKQQGIDVASELCKVL